MMIDRIVRRPDLLTDPVYVVTTVFNPMRFRSRWDLYWKFARMIEAAGGVLYTAEVAFGDRAFVVTQPDNPRHLQLRTNEILWHKERALNLLVQRLPLDWKYVAWIDADVAFARSDFLNETRQLLQVYAIIQMFQYAVDLDYDFNPLKKHLGFAASYAIGVPKPEHANGDYPTPVKHHGVSAWHPGFAWAMRRDAYDTVGGWFDVGITGAGDNHMAKSLIGDGLLSVHPAVSDGYKRAIARWQDRAAFLDRSVSFMNGTLWHYWHGPKVNRRYWDRWQILSETQFDPIDLRSDAHGLYRLPPAAARLRHLLVAYFQQRNEDAPY